MDIFSTAELIGIRNESGADTTFLLNAFFPNLFFSDSEHIAIDKISKGRKLAPFVSPCVQGKVRKKDGRSTQVVTPAYIKVKDVVQPCTTTKRKVGEAINGELSPQDRFDDQQTELFDDHDREISRTEEWMAAKFLWEGKYTIEGEDYPKVEVDFGRDSSLALGNKVWDAAAHPFQDLEDASGAILNLIGAGGTIVLMGRDAWKILQKHEETRALMDRRSGTEGTLTLSPEVAELQLNKGQLGGFDFWVYDGSYIDEAGDAQKFFPSNAVMVINRQELNGQRAYGIVKDFESLEAVERFPKAWMEKDPSGLCMLTQAAPLIFGVGVNAVASFTVSE